MATQEHNAVILARVSSKAQEDEGYSLDSQLKLLMSYCEQRDLKVIKVFKIAETASKDQSRKVYHELLAYIKREKIFHLAVEKTDRLTRNFRDAVAIDEWLEADARRRLHAVKENLLLHKEAKSDVKFMWNIHLSVAKKYTDNLREEAMKGWAEKLAQGWLPAQPPIGYVTVVENGKRIHVLDYDTAPLVKRIFELYLEPGQTLATIQQEMRVMGLTTKKGRPFSKSKVQKILMNPFYIGINRFNGKDYPGMQQPLITKELFDRVQNKMHRKTASRYRQHNPLMKSLIQCADCGGIVTWQLQKGRYYGTCQRKSDACKNRKLLREDRIEEDITKMLENLVCPSEEIIEWVADALKQRHAETVQKDHLLKASIQEQIARIRRMDANLYDDKIAGEIPPELYKEKHAALQEELSALEFKLSSVDDSIGQLLEKKLVLMELTQKAADIYPKRTTEQKRLIITKLFRNFSYKDGAVSVTYTNFARAIAENVQKTRILIGGAI